MPSIPIYQADGGVFLDDTLAELVKGMGFAELVDPPPTGAVVRHVADLQIAKVDDAGVYLVERAGEAVDKATGGNIQPDVAAGKTAIQSLVFDNTKFTAAQAKQWIKDHSDSFADHGVDETGTSFRFRQYDPTAFSGFRNREIAPGITAVFGIAKGHFALDLLVDRDALVKADPATEERYVMSLVLEPNDGTAGAPLKPDTQGDVYSAAEVRKTAHGWMEKGGQVDLQHNWQPLGNAKVRVLESYIAPVDFKLGDYAVRKGSWLLGLRVLDDTLWSAIKSGTIGAFSVGGTAIRRPVEEPAQ